MRLLKRPTNLLEWESAFKNKLTYELSTRLAKGKLSKKNSYDDFFKLLCDYLIDSINALFKNVNLNGVNTEIVFSLNHFCGELQKLYFYKNLKFLTKDDITFIDCSLSEAVSQFVNEVDSNIINENIDITTELRKIKLIANCIYE